MDSIWGANVSAVPPAIPVDAPVGYPTDGSSTGGVNATVPRAFWYYMMSQEILNAIKGGGLTPARLDLTQLNQSIEKRIKAAVDAIGETMDDLLQKVQQVETTPPGAVMAFAMQSPPSQYWLVCDGRAVSRATYPALFDAIGTTYGVGNGSTTFNLPDLRGVFVRGHDAGRNLDPGRGFGSFQDHAMERIYGEFIQAAHDQVHATGPFYNTGRQAGRCAENSDPRFVCAFDSSRVVKTANETRPKNIAFLYCIHV